MHRAVPNDKGVVLKFTPYVRQPHFYETDQMGIVHHSNYVRWMEEARIDMMEQMGYGYAKVSQRGIDLPVLEIHCKYKSMVRFGDTIEIEVALSAFTGTRAQITYTMRQANAPNIVALGESKHCFYSREGRPIALQKTHPDLYDLFALYCQTT